MSAPYRNISICWDFDKDSKAKYFAPLQITSGDFLTSFKDDNYLFYEVCTLQDSYGYIKEALNCEPIHISNICKPFIYVKNLGPSNLYLKLSKDSITCQYWDFDSIKYSGESNTENCNLKLNNGQGALMTLQTNTDGGFYYSFSCLPFGFYYNFTNICSVNPNGLYPSCCYLTTGLIDVECTGTYLECITPSQWRYNNLTLQNCFIYNSISFADDAVMLNCIINDFCVSGYCYTPIYNYFYSQNDLYDYNVTFNGEGIYFKSNGCSNDWFDVANNWYIDEFLTTKASSLPSSGTDVCILGDIGPVINLDCPFTTPRSINATCLTDPAGVCLYSDTGSFFNGTLYGIFTYWNMTQVCHKDVVSLVSLYDFCEFYNYKNCIYSVTPISQIAELEGEISFDLVADGYIYNLFNSDFRKNQPCTYIMQETGYVNCPLFLYENICSGAITGLNRIKSYNFNSQIDNCAHLILDFSGMQFSNVFTSSTSGSGDFFNGNLNINDIYYIDEYDQKISVTDCYLDLCEIKKDCDLIIFYSINATCEKFSKYSYLFSGCSSGVKHVIYNPTCCNIEFESNSLNELISNNSAFCINLNLCDCYVLKSVKTPILDRCNMYLPTYNNFNYDISYFLGKNDYGYSKAQSGNWYTGQNFSNEKFINEIEIISCLDSDYILNKSLEHDINLKIDDSRISSNSIYCKGVGSNSEEFLLYYGNSECCFCVFGLEFRYIPALCYLFNNQTYSIPNILQDVCINENLNFQIPSNAINCKKIKLLSEINIYESNRCICLNLNYSGINTSRIYTNTNDNNIKFPKITLPSLSGYESPEVEIYVYNKINVEKYLDIYTNHFEDYVNDNFYGLNNFLAFVTSAYNSGIAYCCIQEWRTQCSYYSCSEYYLYNYNICEIVFDCVANNCCYFMGTSYDCESDLCYAIVDFFSSNNFLIEFNYSGTSDTWALSGETYLSEQSGTYSGLFSNICSGFCTGINAYAYCQNLYSYNSSDYNFFMMDINDEIYNCCYQQPSGNWQLLDQKINLDELNFNSPLSYRAISGDGHNYILPIVTGINFSNCITYSTGLSLCNQISFTGFLNYKSCGFNFSGGSNCTSGSNIDFCNLSQYATNEYFKYINLKSQDLSNVDLNREICLKSNFKFLGIQPIQFCSNYAITDIKYPILCRNLKEFNSMINENCLNDIYYYTYDLLNFKQTPIRIVSPDLTLINSIQWIDQDSTKEIFAYSAVNFGRISQNSAQINFNLNKIISSNPYEFSINENNCVCINIVGGF